MDTMLVIGGAFFTEQDKWQSEVGTHNFFLSLQSQLRN